MNFMLSDTNSQSRVANAQYIYMTYIATQSHTSCNPTYEDVTKTIICKEKSWKSSFNTCRISGSGTLTISG